MKLPKSLLHLVAVAAVNAAAVPPNAQALETSSQIAQAHLTARTMEPLALCFVPTYVPTVKAEAQKLLDILAEDVDDNAKHGKAIYQEVDARSCVKFARRKCIAQFIVCNDEEVTVRFFGDVLVGYTRHIFTQCSVPTPQPAHVFGQIFDSEGWNIIVAGGPWEGCVEDVDVATKPVSWAVISLQLA